MAASASVETNKTTWCRAYYGQYLNKLGYNIIDIFPCRYGAECRGVHDISELVVKPHIHKWMRQSMARINIMNIMNNIMDVIEKSKDMVTSTKYRGIIQTTPRMRFDELLTFWYDITCYHRRIAKDLHTMRSWANPKSKPPPTEGFFFKEEVPCFYLENEDDVWALERTLHMCPMYMALSTSTTSVKNLCCGDVNCKDGVHSTDNLVCIDNMLTGTCKCMTKTQIDMMKQQLSDEIASLYKQMETSVDEDGFTFVLSKKVKHDMNQKIQSKVTEINSLHCKLHLTEKGLVPLSILIEEHMKTVPKETVEIKEVKKIVKKKY